MSEMDKFDWPITDPYNTVIIARANNGFILTKFETDLASEDDTVFEPVHIVFEGKKENGFGDLDWHCVEDMLWELLESLGLYNSKHRKKRLEISVVDQDE